MFNIQEELKKIPDKPGVYLMKDIYGVEIYVGKAKNLKKRVKQYFQSKTHPSKINKMISCISEFEYIITDTEIEALILEANLIKKHLPKYNSLLRDDKQYPYIKISTFEKYPRVYKVREVKKDGAKYYGPYTSAYAVNETLNAIRNLFPIRKCNNNLDGSKKNNRPCLNYHINNCSVPCMGKISENEYKKIIRKVISFLDGKEKELIKELKQKMDNASKNLDFETAAKYRDQIQSINLIHEKQKVVLSSVIDQDIIGTAIGSEEACVQIFFIRNGKIIGREHYILTNIEDSTEKEIIESFIKQFYTGTVYIPKEIYIESQIDDKELFEELLSQKRGNNVKIKVPIKGEKSMLVKMVKKNARDILEKGSERIKRQMEESQSSLIELKDSLDLSNLPNRIEAFDISNIQGVESVGSMVVFEKGLPKKSDYRRFKINSVQGADDYKSMEEILERRINRGLTEIATNENIKGFNKMPDIILIDGGKGQVNIIENVIANFGLNIPVCGMVKNEHHSTRGLLYKGNEIKLQRGSKLYRLIFRIQEEAHRFAISYHRNLRNKKVFKSELDYIKGIGEKRKLALLKKFGSVENIKTQSKEELIKAEGMNVRAAEAVVNYFSSKKN